MYLIKKQHTKKDTSLSFSMLRCCKMVKSFTIIVEGNIGAGKTTLLDKLKDLPKVKTFKEDINRWKNLNGHNLLNLVYQDPIYSGRRKYIPFF
jgi:ABC-type transport system involved in cytochrome c biogenesis ATPase subunit